MKALSANAILALTAAVLIAAVPANATVVTKPGFSGSVPSGQIFQCQPGTYLVGLTENQTDRIVGAGFVCVSTDGSQLWKGTTLVPPNRVGDQQTSHGETMSRVACPNDFFLVGWRGTFGTYSADTHGLAHPGIQLLADLAPVCRRSDGAFFNFNDGRLHQADDNNLHVVPWDGINGARSCQPGQAAVGVLFNFQEMRNDDPNNRFGDAALICEGLPINIGVVAGSIKVTGKKGPHPHP